MGTDSDVQDEEVARRPRPGYCGPERRARAPRVDLTVNLPTMISILVLIVSTSATGVGLYNYLDKRQMATEYAVANLTARVEKAEGALNSMRIDQAKSNDSLRAEMKADLAEIKGQLDRLIFGGQPQQRQLRQWSR